VLFALAVAIGLVASNVAAHPSASACRRAAIHLASPTQGENTTVRVDLEVRNAGPRCHLGGTAALTVMRAAVPASVRGNPLRRTINRWLAQGVTTLVRADWTNWCGTRSDIRLRVRLNSLVLTRPLQKLPLCLQASARSRLLAIK
jgi:hypothetical protein